MTLIGEAMRRAGRSVRLVSDAIDARDNPVLSKAGKRLGCGACLSIIEAGFRAPLDRVAMLRLNTLIQSTGAEPVMVMRPEDAPLAVTLSKIGLKRIILVRDENPLQLGPVFTALRDSNLVIAEVMDMREKKAVMTPARASEMAVLLTE